MASTTSEANPFASRFVRPGAIPFLFDRGGSTEALMQSLRRHGWWGQIIGPHGSGKSTLIESLIGPLERAGRRVVRFTLHDGQRRLPRGSEPPAREGESVQWIVDGYEQLGWLNRRRLKAACRRCRAGLLVTAHADAGLPVVWETAVSLDTGWRIVAQLAGGTSVDRGGQLPISQDDVAAGLQRHGGNFRETLFDLYDLYEQRRA